MKTITCKQLGGACDTQFHAETFDEMAEMSKSHAMKMMGQGEPTHLKAMKEMGELMSKPEEMAKWFKSKQKMFDDLSENQMD